MPLTLNELMKKAKAKGIDGDSLIKKAASSSINKPWQQESLLFSANANSKEQEEKDKNDKNRKQTGNKPETNRKQIGNKSETNRKQNRKPETKWKQNRKQSGNKTGNKVETKTSFLNLVGLQRTLINFIYNACKNNNSRTTNNLTLKHIGMAINHSSEDTIKTTIRRLEEKELIKRIAFKNGRGGWSKYTLPELVFEEVLKSEIENNLTINWEQSGNKTGNKVETKPETKLPLVSSYILNTNYRSLNIPDNWTNIDLTPLESIGFDPSHLVQIHRAYEKTPNVALSPELIQSSIDAFAYDLKNNEIEKAFKKPAAVILLSLLKKGQPYSSITPDKCTSLVQDALNKHNQMLMAQRAKEQQLLQQIQETEFALWREGLSEEQLLDFCPESELASGVPVHLRKTYRKRKAKELTKDYFDAEIWPEKKQTILAAAARKQTMSSELQTLAESNNEVES